MDTDSPTLQLDPDRFVCWEDERTLRVGFDPVIARITDLTEASASLVAALMTGIPGERLDAQERETRELGPVIEQLRPLLVRRARSGSASAGRRRHPEASDARSAIRAFISDDGREIAELQSALEIGWLCRFDRSPAPPELAVQVIRFLEPLERTRRWLARRVPCLVVRLTHEAARIGPLIAAGGAPCHSCEVLGLVGADPMLPALAAQLYGRVPRAESSAVAQYIGAIAVNFVTAWRDGESWVHETQVALPVARGIVCGLPTLTTIATHPECGCALSD